MILLHEGPVDALFRFHFDQLLLFLASSNLFLAVPVKSRLVAVDS